MFPALPAAGAFRYLFGVTLVTLPTTAVDVQAANEGQVLPLSPAYTKHMTHRAIMLMQRQTQTEFIV